MATSTHCNFCGGVITDPTKIEFRPPSASVQIAPSTPERCVCQRPIVYEHSPIEPPPPEDVEPR